MATLTTASYFVALLLFLGVVYIQTLRTAPAEDVRAGWPLRRFWVGAGLRHLGLVLVGMAALLGVVSAVANGVWGEQFAYRPLLFAGAMVLLMIATTGLLYSIALYWQKSVAKADGF